MVVDGGGPREESALQGRRGEVVVDERRFRRHGLQDTAAFVVPVSPDRARRCVPTTIVACSCVDIRRS